MTIYTYKNMIIIERQSLTDEMKKMNISFPNEGDYDSNRPYDKIILFSKYILNYTENICPSNVNLNNLENYLGGMKLLCDNKITRCICCEFKKSNTIEDIKRHLSTFKEYLIESIFRLYVPFSTKSLVDPMEFIIIWDFHTTIFDKILDYIGLISCQSQKSHRFSSVEIIKSKIGTTNSQQEPKSTAEGCCRDPKNTKGIFGPPKAPIIGEPSKSQMLYESKKPSSWFNTSSAFGTTNPQQGPKALIIGEPSKSQMLSESKKLTFGTTTQKPSSWFNTPTAFGPTNSQQEPKALIIGETPKSQMLSESKKLTFGTTTQKPSSWFNTPSAFGTTNPQQKPSSWFNTSSAFGTTNPQQQPKSTAFGC